MQVKRDKRDVHGVLLLDKPLGMSSNKALQRVKYLLRARKAGHTGSLDPLATGMLPLCFGDATRYSHVFLDADKTYDVTATLGGRSATGDAEGDIVQTAPVPFLSLEDWQAIGDQFLGESKQVPPMYSALKHDGKRLYDIARKGGDVERPPRRIVIEYLTITAVGDDSINFSVRCSKGTYIRSLVEDLATTAGTLAWTSMLRRTAVSPFSSAMVTMEALEAAGDTLPELLAGCDAGLTNWAQVMLTAPEALAFCQGRLASLPSGQPGPRRCYGPNGLFLGTALTHADGSFADVRVMSAARMTLETARVR
ncbi:MAG: tRNA pseudouridine(55) synthase TruB [Pseudomonadota bacterium]